MSDTANLGFNKIHDVVYDSRINQSLQGVYPNGFRVLTAFLDLVPLPFGIGFAAITDDDGNNIALPEGTQILRAHVGVEETIDSAFIIDASRLVLSPTPGTAGDQITSDASGTMLNTTGSVTQFAVNGGVVGATNKYVSFSYTKATTPPPFIAGTLKITLVVV